MSVNLFIHTVVKHANDDHRTIDTKHGEKKNIYVRGFSYRTQRRTHKRRNEPEGTQKKKKKKKKKLRKESPQKHVMATARQSIFS